MIDSNSVPEFYQGYLKKIYDGTVVENLLKSGVSLTNSVKSIPEAKGAYAYATGKWSIKEVILHLIDSERIFGYRALRFSREDPTDLPGFEQNDYVPASKANERSLVSLLQEFQNLRTSTMDMFASFDAEMMSRKGTANGYAFSVEALGYVISGHCLHHLNIINERYLNVD